MGAVKSIGQCKKKQKKNTELCKTGLVMKHQGGAKLTLHELNTPLIVQDLVNNKTCSMYDVQSLEIAHILSFKVNCTQ